MEHLTQGTTNLIHRLGGPVIIKTPYMIEYSDPSHPDVLILTSLDGIRAGANLAIKQVNYVSPEGPLEMGIISVDEETRSIILRHPLTEDLPPNSPAEVVETTKGVPIPRFKRITYEELEYIRKLRVPETVVVDYGSQVTWLGREFFVVGLDPGDNSMALTLREINSRVTIVREIRSEESTSWATPAIPEVIAENIPAHIQFNTADLPGRSDLGYVPTNTSIGIIPLNYLAEKPVPTIVSRVELEDKIISGEDVFKVAGFDWYTHKKLLTLKLVYDVSK